MLATRAVIRKGTVTPNRDFHKRVITPRLRRRQGDYFFLSLSTSNITSVPNININSRVLSISITRSPLSEGIRSRQVKSVILFTASREKRHPV